MFLSYANTVAGAMLLGFGFMHILPEAAREFEPYAQRFSEFPFVYASTLIGFWVVLTVEKMVVIRLQENDRASNGRAEIHGQDKPIPGTNGLEAKPPAGEPMHRRRRQPLLPLGALTLQLDESHEPLSRSCVAPVIPPPPPPPPPPQITTGADGGRGGPFSPAAHGAVWASVFPKSPASPLTKSSLSPIAHNTKSAAIEESPPLVTVPVTPAVSTGPSPTAPPHPPPVPDSAGDALPAAGPIARTPPTAGASTPQNVISHQRPIPATPSDADRQKEREVTGLEWDRNRLTTSSNLLFEDGGAEDERSNRSNSRGSQTSIKSRRSHEAATSQNRSSEEPQPPRTVPPVASNQSMLDGGAEPNHRKPHSPHYHPIEHAISIAAHRREPEHLSPRLEAGTTKQTGKETDPLLHPTSTVGAGLPWATPAQPIPPVSKLPPKSTEDEMAISEISETHAHGFHSHGAGAVPQDLSRDERVIRVYILLCGMSLHAIFEGLALGLQSTQSSVTLILIGISLHKFSEAFALGIAMTKTFASASTENAGAGKGGMSLPALLLTLYAMICPLGIGIGMCFISFLTPYTATAVTSLLNGFAVGVFLYVSILGIVVEELASTKRVLSKISLSVVVCLAMGLLSLF